MDSLVPTATVQQPWFVCFIWTWDDGAFSDFPPIHTSHFNSIHLPTA